MGNSTPQDSPQDQANDFLETEEELNLDDIDWSMLTDLSTKITTGLDAAAGKKSDTSTSAASPELDLPNWAEGGDEDDASLIEMLGLEGLDDFDGDLGEELDLGIGNDDFGLSDDQEFADMADITVVNASPEIPISTSNEFELADLYNPSDELGELDEFGEEAPITTEVPSNEGVSWNLTEQDLQGFANPDHPTSNSDDEPSWGGDEPSWGDNEQYAKSIEDADAQFGADSYTSYGANSTDVPDYYADEFEPEVFDQKDIQTPSQNLMSDFDTDTSDEAFAELIAPRDIPNVQQPKNIAAPTSHDAHPAADWEFPNVPEAASHTAKINHDFSDLDASDEEFSDSTKIESDSSRSTGGADLSSARYSAAWEQELSSSYYSETTDPGSDESFNPEVVDQGWAPTSDDQENLNLDIGDIGDIEDVFGDPENIARQEELGLTSSNDFADIDDTNINRSGLPPEAPQVLSLPPLPTLPPLPPLPSLDSSKPSQASSNVASPQNQSGNKSQRGFEQFDLPDFEWSETVSPRSGNNTGLRQDQSSDPGQNPSSAKPGLLPGSTEYKKAISENLSSDMSWSEILDMQPDISTDPINIPARKQPNDPANQSTRSNFAPPSSRQGRSPTQNLANNMPVDRVDRIEQMGAFSDAGNTDFNSPGFAGMLDSLEPDDLMPVDLAEPAKPKINIPELWEQYRGNLKIPAIALGAIAAIFGFFSIPPIKRFTVETGLRIGFNKDASGQDLTGINFKGGNLEKVNFSKANLTNANLESANLKGANLIGTKLDGANLQKSDLKGARLVEASLVLASATLNLADLSNANLSKANLSKASMNGTLLKGSKLDLQDPKSATKIDPEDLLMWQIVNEPRANRNLAGINLTGFNLSSANLQGAKLTDAKLTWSDLSKSDLSNAKLSGAELSGANLQGANLKGASLAQATWVKERAPKTDNQTICPNGTQGPCKL
jgi:uncharacterized protein YjbI with pentapeptide repeats